MRTILLTLALASCALALSPVELGAACAWTVAGATALTAAISGGKATVPVQVASSFTLGSMAYTLAAPTKWTDAHLHFMASGAIYAGSYVGARQLMPPLPAGLAAGAFTLGLGALKEWRDSRQAGNRWDWKDIRSNVIGVVTSAAITAGVDALMHGR
jgi:uncharacterized protein YfiM (DUF2279 family)